jgi:hypothetical protein
MTTKTCSFHILLLSLLLITVIEAGPLHAARPADDRGKPSGSARKTATDFTGTWSGTFFSTHANVAAFTMTVVVAPDSQGHLIGTSTLNSDCLKDVRLEVSVSARRMGARATWLNTSNTPPVIGDRP